MMRLPDEKKLDRTLKALADPTRRAMVSRLLRCANGLSVGELAEPFLEEMSLPAVSKHVKRLGSAGLVRQVREGKTLRCHAIAEPLHALEAWTAFHRTFWSGQLDALANYVEPTGKRIEKHQPTGE